MIEKQLPFIERNFHIMNDDRFIMEKISLPIEQEEGEDLFDAVNRTRAIIIENFKAAYPHVEESLNFHVVKQQSSKWEIPKIKVDAPLQEVNVNGFKNYGLLVPEGVTTNAAGEKHTLKQEYKYPIATAETVKKEMENYKLSSKIFTAVYGEQIKGNAELEKIYADKLKQLQYIETESATKKPSKQKA